MAINRKNISLFILFFFVVIILAAVEINGEPVKRLKRQGAPLFLDWTAPRRGPSPMGANGPYGPFGVGLVGIMQGVIFGGR